MLEIEKIRKEINKIDEKIINLLKQRKEKVIFIGKVKKIKNLPIADKNREKEILSSLDSDYEKNIYKNILTESRKLQF